MRCENYFCIYWSEDICCLDSISLDILGNCQDCIYVTINEEILQQARLEQLNRYQDIE